MKKSTLRLIQHIFCFSPDPTKSKSSLCCSWYLLPAGKKGKMRCYSIDFLWRSIVINWCKLDLPNLFMSPTTSSAATNASMSKLMNYFRPSFFPPKQFYYSIIKLSPEPQGQPPIRLLGLFSFNGGISIQLSFIQICNLGFICYSSIYQCPSVLPWLSCNRYLRLIWLWTLVT